MLGSLGDQSKQFGKAVDSLSELIQGLAARKTDISQRAGLHQRRRRQRSQICCTRLAPPIAKTLARRPTGSARPRRSPTTTTSTTCSTRCPTSTRQLGRQGLYGDYFSFYMCDILLKVNGKGGQPVYIKVAGQDTGTVRAEMKSFAERNPLIIGAVGIALTAGLTVAALEYDKLPFISLGHDLLRLLRRSRWADYGCSGGGFRLSGGSGERHRPRRRPCSGHFQRSTTTSNWASAPKRRSRPRALLGAKILEVRPRGEGHLAGTDSGRAHHVALPAARCDGRPGYNDQRAQHVVTLRLAGHAGQDVREHPARSQARHRRGGPLRPGARRARCPTAQTP